MGFIERDHKQSASFNWTVNSAKQSQQLDLTTFLGINILHVESNGNHHRIEAMNTEVEGDNLSEMIRSIVHINLPTQALSFWLKGQQYQLSDSINYHKDSHLPETLNSHFEGQDWQVQYLQHRIATLPSGEQVALASKLRIYQGDLIIKLNINSWKIL